MRTADLDQVAVSVKPTDGDIARSLRRVQEPGTLREDPALGLHTEGSVIPGTVLVSKLRSNVLHWSFGCDSYRVDLKFEIVQVFLFNILIVGIIKIGQFFFFDVAPLAYRGGSYGGKLGSVSDRSRIVLGSFSDHSPDHSRITFGSFLGLL